MSAGMRVDRMGALLCAGTLGRVGLLDTSHVVAVLMYHSVSEANEPGLRPYYRLTISPRRFREQMRLLADQGYVVTGLPDALLPEHDLRHERRVVVTFDDGYLDFLGSAWPVLEELSFTATVFLPTAFIGDTRRSFKGRECLTWSEVRDLAQRGISFGSHTVTHPVLRDMPWSEVRRELRDSRDEMERQLGAPVTTFAYPFAFPQQDAAFVSSFSQEARALGYRISVTTVIGRHRTGDDPLRVKRLPVNDADDLRLFSAKLNGAYDWVGALQSAWKRVR